MEIINKDYMDRVERWFEENAKRCLFLSQHAKKSGIVLLTKKQNDGSQVLVDIDNTIGTNYIDRYDIAKKILDRNAISTNLNNWCSLANYEGFCDIPEDTSYCLYMFCARKKRCKCLCDDGIYHGGTRNYTIVMGQYSNPLCMCESCLFDTLNIVVPETFYESMKGKEENVQI